MKLHQIFEADDPAEDVSAEPTVVLKDTAEVAQHVYPYLVQRIEKLNKRARKNKLPEIKLEITKEYTREVSARDPLDGEVDARLPKKQIPYYSIKVSGDAPVIAGYKFMATIEHQEGGNIIRTVPGEEGNKNIKAFYEAKPHYCDHCKKVRRRVDTFIVKEEKTGKLRQIGRNCLADFLGGADPKAILWYFDNRDNIARLVREAEESTGAKRARVDEFMALEPVLEMAAALIREFGYLSSKKAQEMYQQSGAYSPTTASDLRWVLFGWKKQISPREQKVLDTAKGVTAADKKQVQDVLAWFKQLPEDQKQASEFMHNLDVIVKSDKVNPRNIGFAVALFPAYAHAMNMVKQKEVAAQKPNEYVGAVGQKLPPTKVKVLFTRGISSDFGTSQLVAMEDEKGNRYTWFNSSSQRLEDGKEYTITGTIKAHNEYKGQKQTVLKRVKAV